MGHASHEGYMPATKVPLRIEIDFFGCSAVGKQEYAARKIWIPLSPFRILADMFQFFGVPTGGTINCPTFKRINIIILRTG